MRVPGVRDYVNDAVIGESRPRVASIWKENLAALAATSSSVTSTTC